MSVAERVEKRGRPELYGANFTRSFKTAVRKYGLSGAREILNREGVVVRGKLHKLKISIPTLSKYVRKENVGGKAVVLRLGRRVAKVQA